MKKVILKKEKKIIETIKIKCPNCNGSGIWEDEFDQFDDNIYTCPKCKGKGKIKVKVFKKSEKYYCI